MFVFSLFYICHDKIHDCHRTADQSTMRAKNTRRKNTTMTMMISTSLLYQMWWSPSPSHLWMQHSWWWEGYMLCIWGWLQPEDGNTVFDTAQQSEIATMVLTHLQSTATFSATKHSMATERMEALIESCVDPIVQIDSHGTIILANPVCCVKCFSTAKMRCWGKM